MFSGIVQGMAEVKNVKNLGEGRRFYIDIGKFTKNLRSSYSISISGCCLTVASLNKGIASFDVMPETLRKTYFSSLKKGDKVNIERSLKLGDEIGGHFVSGHVDCTGKIIKKTNMKDFSEMDIEFPQHFSHLLIDKGSVAVDGISLTVVEAKKRDFTVALIPETLKLTTMGFKKQGGRVNLEFDQMAKYVAKLMGK
ncbi:MAG: riboflavin synthase [Candidatus Aenigmarchaeota archaeon]|nr:riboflavin synthase [Candidatus Aenigmarchaeota archaeon]